MTERTLIAFDCETHLIQPGLVAPPLVCGSIAWQEGESLEGSLLSAQEARTEFVRILYANRETIAGANISFDMLVMAVDAARRGEDLMPLIFDSYDQGRVFDVQIAEALHGVALGLLGKDPRTGQPLINPETGKRGRYSLATCVDIVLGRSNAKANDRYRLSYALLESTPIAEWPLEARTYPVDDAINTLEVALEQERTRSNLANQSAQVYAAWAMHLGAAWGFLPDPIAVDTLAKKAESARVSGQEEFVTAGLLRRDPKSGETSKDTSAIKRRVAVAFGASNPCFSCAGTGTAAGKGKKPIGCKSCASTGFDLDSAPQVPRTETGGVGTDRDTLVESGDETLMAFAAHSEADKIESTYLPWLRSGIDANGKARPITLRPNVLLETGRASYADVVQLLPRDMGIRECIVARPGTYLASVDYGGLELVTHAQSCLWIVGWSKLAEYVNREGASAAHAALGAQLAGLPYEEYVSRMKGEPFLKACRQAAKAANFGFPGGMGASKLVLQQRKSGPDTTGPDGKRYRGLRFCILMDGAKDCGIRKVISWKDRPIPPTCAACIECAERLRETWFATFPENRPYFRAVADTVERYGEVKQHVSGRVRGGVEFCAAANGYFQGLAADGAKLALCRVAREQYVDRGTALFGSRTILFAHDEILAEVPIDRAHDAAMRISELMIGAMREYCPDVAVEAPPALMRRWTKAGEPRFSDGRLIPWEPK